MGFDSYDEEERRERVTAFAMSVLGEKTDCRAHMIITRFKNIQ